MNKKVTILRGVPGAGKSTYIKNNLSGAIVCSADHYFIKSDGQYVFDATKLGEAHGQCLRIFEHELLNGEPHVVVDNTNINAVDIAPYAALALAHGYQLEIITLKVDPDVAHARNIHGVPHRVCVGGTHRLEYQEKHFSPWWPHRVVKQ